MSMKTTLFFDSSGEFWTICENMIQQTNENEEDKKYTKVFLFYKIILIL